MSCEFDKLKKIFVTGAARSGTNLIARTINEHSTANIAIDPIIPFFSHYRDAVIRASADTLLYEFLGKPINDYYFSDNQLKLLNLILSSDFGENVGVAEREAVLKACSRRSELDSSDLAQDILKISGSSYNEILSKFFNLVAGRSSEKNLTHVGFKDLWVPEFIPAMAKSFPEAQFIIVVRDIRAVLGSMVKLRATKPELSAHAISYVRQWRKLIACLSHFMSDKNLASRVLAVRYEDFVQNSSSEIERMCRFLDLEFEVSMLGDNGYKDPATGNRWKSNSSFDDKVHGIAHDTLSRWERVLSPDDRAMVSLMCEMELNWLGYDDDPIAKQMGSGLVANAWRSFSWNDKHPGKWRSDSDDVYSEFANELARHAFADMLIKKEGGASEVDLRRFFLFENATPNSFTGDIFNEK